MTQVTVITPTYNRAKELKRLYESLLAQTDNDFCWLIIDDGSTDDTENVVQQWIREDKIPLEYIKKPNGGKHTALNVGIPKIETPWTFIVDSDDYLTKNAIELINQKISSDDSDVICGLAFLRQSSNGSLLTNKVVPQDGMIDDFCHCRYWLDIQGDMAEVWKTNCLKEFPFPEFPNEKFCSEDVVWISMAQKYKMRFYNDVVYMCDYLDGGLTRSRRKQNRMSPKGVMNRGIIQLGADLPLKYKCKAMMYYQVYGKAAGYSYRYLFRESENKLLYVTMFCLSRIAYKKLI